MTDFKCPGIVAALVLTMLFPVPLAAQSKDVTGVWVTDEGDGAVAIEPCGDKRCGRLVWLKAPLDKTGRPQRDVNNPEPAARRLPVCGVEIIKDATLQNDGSWDGGSIYDPEEGKVYSVMLKTDDKDRLEVTGYIGIKSFGETVVWTRSAEQLKQCQPNTPSKPK